MQPPHKTLPVHTHAHRAGMLCDVKSGNVFTTVVCSVPARLGKGQGAKEIGHNLACERPKFGHNLVRKRHKIFYA